MSLQGSVHKWSDGIGYGAFIPTDKAYYNARIPTANEGAKRRPSSETIRNYRRQNVTAGVDTHRSGISFGRTTDSVRGGVVGESRAREATKSLTSGEVGGFVWLAERRREGNAEKMAALSPNCRGGPGVGGASATTSITPARSAHSLKEQTAQAQVVEELRNQRDGTDKSVNSARSCTSSNCSGGGSSWRSGATSSSAFTSSSVSYDSSMLSSARSTCSSNTDDVNDNHQYRTRRRSATPPTTRSVRSSENDANNSSSGTNTGRQLSHRSTNGTTPRETRLGPVSPATPGTHERLEQHTARRRNPAIPPASPATARQLSQFKTLDPVFQPHNKYDLIAQKRAARGGEVTGRFGPVDGSSVLAASLLTSELSTPWSHVLRGQKW